METPVQLLHLSIYLYPSGAASFALKLSKDDQYDYFTLQANRRTARERISHGLQDALNLAFAEIEEACPF